MSPTCKDIFKPSHSSKQLCRLSPRFPSPAASAPRGLSLLLPSRRTCPAHLPGHHSPLVHRKPGTGSPGEGRWGKEWHIETHGQARGRKQGDGDQPRVCRRRAGARGTWWGAGGARREGAAPHRHRVGQPGL